MWPFSSYEYFAVIKLESFLNATEVQKTCAKKVKRKFFWKGRKVKYYEPFTNSNHETFIVLGTTAVNPKKYSNNMALLLELSATMRDSSIQINEEEYSVVKEQFEDYSITYYKVKQ